MLYFEKYNSLEHWQAQSESNAVWHSLGPWGFTYNSLYAHIKRETERVENKSKLSLLFFFFLYPVFLAFKIHFLLAFDVVLIKTERARVSVIFFWLLHAMNEKKARRRRRKREQGFDNCQSWSIFCFINKLGKLVFFSGKKGIALAHTHARELPLF